MQTTPKEVSLLMTPDCTERTERGGHRHPRSEEGPKASPSWQECPSGEAEAPDACCEGTLLCKSSRCEESRSVRQGSG